MGKCRLWVNVAMGICRMGICRMGICRMGICRMGICRLTIKTGTETDQYMLGPAWKPIKIPRTSQDSTENISKTPPAYFATQPHVGERLLGDEGLVVLLLNIEKSVAGVKWYRNPLSFYYRLPSASCWTLERRVRSTWGTLPHMARQSLDQRPKKIPVD